MYEYETRVIIPVLDAKESRISQGSEGKVGGLRQTVQNPNDSFGGLD